MAAVDRRGCDGCGRTLPIEDLAAVTLGGDEQAICCPRCREHMESVVQDATPETGPDAGLVGDCSGCGETYAVANLQALELPDGDTVACCEDCHEHARSMSRRTDVDGNEGTCSGCDEQFDVNEMAAVTLADGTTVACCADCAAYARDAADQMQSDGTQRDDGSAHGEPGSTRRRRAKSRASPSSRRGSPRSGPNRSQTEALALADDPAVCDQCGDWVNVELFEVVTIDDRTEEFCPPCTDRARARGVVKEVRMRRREAADALDVDLDASQRSIREAYLSKIKAVHPDATNGSSEAFRRVQRAYERLTED